MKLKVFFSLLVGLSLAACSPLDKARNLAKEGQKEEAAQIALELLKDKEASTRAEAAQLLGELKVENAAKPLLNLLDDPDLAVQKAAVTSLGEIGSQEVMFEVISKFPRANYKVVPAYQKALDKLNAGKFIVADWNNPKLPDGVREDYVFTLKNLPSVPTEGLIQLVKERYTGANKPLLDILVKNQAVDLSPLLVDYLVQGNLNDIEPIILSLAERDSRMIEQLVSALDKHQGTQQDKLLVVLGDIGGRAEMAVPKLVAMSNGTGNLDQQKRLNQTLKKIRGF